MNDFLHYLRNTIILLGGRVDIADRLLVIDLLGESDVDALRQYNIDLLESLKDRFANLTKNEIQVATNSSEDEY